MTRIIKGQVIALAALMTVMVVTLAACGGGSSSTGGGGGSGSTVRGTVDNGVAAVAPSGEQTWLAAAANVVIEPASAAGVAGVTVELVDSGGATVASTTTDADGDFEFNNVAPGDYTIRLLQDGTALGETPTVRVDAATETKIELSLNGNVTSVEVEAEGNQISGSVEDDLSSDDDSLDDDSSDDDSLDDDSLDDDSSDDDSSDV